MPRRADRNPDSAPGDWYIDTRCIDCAASREVAPGLIVHRHGKSVFARQPASDEEELSAWRAVLVCPTASVRTEQHHRQPPDLFPQELAPGVFRCGSNHADTPQVTDEMTAAGASALAISDDCLRIPADEDIVTAIFLAMISAMKRGAVPQDDQSSQSPL